MQTGVKMAANTKLQLMFTMEGQVIQPVHAVRALTAWSTNGGIIALVTVLTLLRHFLPVL